MSTTLWKVFRNLILVTIIDYFLIAFFLPRPKEPNPISLEGSIFEKAFEERDGQFVSFYVTKTLSGEESSRYIQDWEALNSGLDLRDLTELVGFDKPLKNISRIRVIVLIDCSNGNYHRFEEEQFDHEGRLIHYISSDETHKKWYEISKNSTIGAFARRFCERSKF
jgi:hypothetical protein